MCKGHRKELFGEKETFLISIVVVLHGVYVCQNSRKCPLNKGAFYVRKSYLNKVNLKCLKRKMN